MCVVSMIGDAAAQRWRYVPAANPPMNPIDPKQGIAHLFAPVTRAEFDTLKAEVELVHELLRKAKVYDEANGEPDCEVDDKVAVLKAVAELVGVDLSDVFGS